jgi:hypothetical protein
MFHSPEKRRYFSKKKTEVFRAHPVENSNQHASHSFRAISIKKAEFLATRWKTALAETLQNRKKLSLSFLHSARQHDCEHSRHTILIWHIACD